MMKDEMFISEIKINKSRNVKNLTIPLSKDERKHLIITGKNGSGKTTLLIEINNFLKSLFNGNYNVIETHKNGLAMFEKDLELLMKDSHSNEQKLLSIRRSIKSTKEWFKQFGDLDLSFTNYYKIPDEAVSN